MKDTFWVGDSSLQSPVSPVPKKRKRRVGKRKIEFVGWGSRPLIEFLEAIGKDTREKHPRQEVAAFISKYINDKGLTSAEKKKKVLCDERLFALFGKKSMSRIKVFDMLEEHFAENHNDSDDDFLDSSDEDYGEKDSSQVKKIPTGQMKKVLKTPKSCYAAVTPENIKLIYLKRSVIQDLLKVPESFEFKVVGSFVRLKSDPNDIYQKNRFQLQQVTGIEKISGTGDADIETHLLRVSNFFKGVDICMLSDDNFTKEEVEDVWDRIKAGSLNRLTVNVVQLKAQVLHVDITKNWIAKEISLLQKLAEHANEKGWQREKFEYLERRKLLQKQSEQEKLLLKLPEVVAEELEPEAMVTVASEKAEISVCSPQSILRGSSNVSSTDASGSGDIGTPPKVILSTLQVQNGWIDWVADVPLPKGSGESDTPPKVILSDSHTLQVQNVGIDWVADIPLKDPKGSAEIGTPPEVISSDSRTLEAQNGGIDWVANIPLKDPKDIIKQEMLVTNANCGESSRETQGIGVGDNEPPGRGEPEQPLITAPTVICNGNSTATQVMGSGEKNPQPPSATTVIELSDDDSEDDVPDSAGISHGENPNDAVWHYADPQGQTQGPFPLSLLKRWSDANYFPSGFTVWKTGQTSHEGLVLVDVLHRTFPY
ncbi:uncharacterized protein At5g08430-like isoform X2 [Salvia miltiorrhiza]|uniref:uncharacterized protein At5g08430-like isoform X2 n=1 Tax=Salvia miltiorrhiza TaxID=226208 RepID=UPI0025ABBAEB|nr:uncharacterized protein At5g08430-like isoform X2 [Salvia miltiorrhiza]